MANYLFIKVDGVSLKTSFSDVIYIEAVNKYVRIITKKKVYLIAATMHYIENILPSDLFCRIHRSYIVSLEHTDKFDNDILFIASKELPIGKQYKNNLCSKVTTLFSETSRDRQRILNVEIDKLLKKINS